MARFISYKEPPGNLGHPAHAIRLKLSELNNSWIRTYTAFFIYESTASPILTVVFNFPARSQSVRLTGLQWRLACPCFFVELEYVEYNKSKTVESNESPRLFNKTSHCLTSERELTLRCLYPVHYARCRMLSSLFLSVSLFSPPPLSLSRMMFLSVCASACGINSTIICVSVSA